MMPILGRYGPFFLTSHFVALGLGTLLALAVTHFHARRLGLTGWIDGVLLGAGIAIVAGRLTFVLLNQDYFSENTALAWSIWQGGLNAQAALLVGLLTYAGWTYLTHRPPGDYFDLIAPGLAIVTVAGWAACWFEGCAYGRETIPGLFSAGLPDDYGVLAVRYQTQALGFLLSAIVAGLASWQLSRRPWGSARSGVLFWLTLAALMAIQALVALFRGDPSPVWFGFRADLLVALLIAGSSLLVALSRLTNLNPRAH